MSQHDTAGVTSVGVVALELALVGCGSAEKTEATFSSATPTSPANSSAAPAPTPAAGVNPTIAG